MDINEAVYSVLAEGTDTVAEAVNKYNAAKAEVDSGKYSATALDEIYRPRMMESKKEMERQADAVLTDARNLVSRFMAEAEAKNELDPALITDDIKLLNAGIKLMPRDILAILKRNEGNRTMQQLAIRYAQEHEIDTPELKQYIFQPLGERATAQSLNEIIKLYEKWITTPDGPRILNRFFNRA